jgi:ribose/xylose/arabinose/galactoside ABC-type transport system permease subunit
MEQLMSNATAETTVDTRRLQHGRVGLIVNRFGIYLLAVIFILVGVFVSDQFLTAQNFLNILDAVTLLGIVAVGAAFVTYSGHFADLSIPTTMAFSGVVAVELLGLGLVPALLAGLAVGGTIGIINGFVIGKFKANPIVWTLAMSFVTRGVMRWAWQNKQIYPDVQGGETGAGTAFINLWRIRLFDTVSITLIVLVIMAVVLGILMSRTRFGQQLKLTGSNMEVARMTGVNVPRTVGIAFVISAVASAVGGLFLTSLSKVGAYYNGEGYDFDAVTAIVIGGMTLAGGRGSIVGVLGGVFVIGLMSNIMTLLGIDTFAQSIVKGVIFILAVGINAKSLRSLGRDDA